MAKYALIPTMPTPNGPLHLGHIAGPYLKPDIIARHLRRFGHDVAIVSGSDVWETHVLQKGRELGISPEAVCYRYNEEIKKGLEALNIAYDAYINPLIEPYRGRLNEISCTVVNHLELSGKTKIVTENIPYSLKYEEPLIGSAVAGTCPFCGDDDVGGFHCEACGREISPGELLAVYSDLPDDEFIVAENKSLFLTITEPEKLLKLLHQKCSDKDLIKIAADHLTTSGNLVRLSHPGHWGIEYKSDHLKAGVILFSFPGLFAFSLLCGEIAGEILQASTMPLVDGTEVISVNLFGFDNTVPFFVAALGQAVESNRWAPADYYLTNRFYTLDGSKFSTSRGHAIWATEAQKTLNQPADFIRLYLAKTSPEFAENDFSTHDFQIYSQALARKLDKVNQAIKNQSASPYCNYKELLGEVLKRQADFLEFKHFKMRLAVEVLEEWLALGETQVVDRSWAAGFALLATPFMPVLAESIWLECGLVGYPTIATFNGAFLACLSNPGAYCE